MKHVTKEIILILALIRGLSWGVDANPSPDEPLEDSLIIGGRAFTTFREARVAILGGLQSEEPLLRADAVRAAWQVGQFLHGTEIVPALESAIDSGMERELRWLALGTLITAADRRSIPCFERMTRSPDERTRALAACGAAELRHGDAIPRFARIVLQSTDVGLLAQLAKNLCGSFGFCIELDLKPNDVSVEARTLRVAEFESWWKLNSARFPERFQVAANLTEESGSAAVASNTDRGASTQKPAASGSVMLSGTSQETKGSATKAPTLLLLLACLGGAALAGFLVARGAMRRRRPNS